MKILFCCSADDWHMEHWIKYWSDNHEVLIITDLYYHTKKLKFSNNVKIIEMKGVLSFLIKKYKVNNKFWSYVNKIISIIHYSLVINKIALSENVDYVHAHSLYYGAICFNINKRVPVIFTPMGSDIIIHAQKSIAHRIFAIMAFKRSNIVTGDSFLLQEKGLLVGASLNNNYIIQNGVDSKLFFPGVDKRYQLFKLDRSDIIIFSPRSLAKLYNIKTILEAIYILKNRKINVYCLLTYAFGDEYIDDLKNYANTKGIKENLIWLGYLNQSKMPEIYNSSDIIVSVPDSDSSPKSVYEAMFCKKPVILSDLTWTNEFFKDGNYFLRVHPKDSVGLANSIEYYIKNQKIGVLHSENCFIKVNEHFDYYKNMKRLEDLLISFKKMH